MWETAPDIGGGSVGVAQLYSLFGKHAHLWSTQKARQKDTDEKEGFHTT